MVIQTVHSVVLDGFQQVGILLELAQRTFYFTKSVLLRHENSKQFITNYSIYVGPLSQPLFFLVREPSWKSDEFITDYPVIDDGGRTAQIFSPEFDFAEQISNNQLRISDVNYDFQVRLLNFVTFLGLLILSTIGDCSGIG